VRDLNGRWQLGRGGTTAAVDVGWTLTEHLRNQDVLPALRAHLAGWLQPSYEWSEEELAELRETIPGFVVLADIDAEALAAPVHAPVPDTDALWEEHLRRDQEITDNAVEIGGGEEPYPDLAKEIHEKFERKREGAQPAGVTARELAAWAPSILEAARAELSTTDGNLWRFHDPLWWHAGDGWLEQHELLEACRVRARTNEWELGAMHWLIRAGDAEATTAALALWDRTHADGSFDPEYFAELASLLHRERPAALDLVFEPAWFNRVGRALSAGFINVLHSVRADFEASRQQWRSSAPGSEGAWAGFCSVVEVLASPNAGTDVFDPADADELRAAFVQFARAPPEHAWTIADDVLVVSAYCGWTDVAQALLAHEAGRDTILYRMQEMTWVRPALVRGVLALSLLVPGADCLGLLGTAHRSLPTVAESGDDRDMALAVAIAWQRCQRALAT
ncbi:MAG: hypothetical protein ACREO3_01395, partial [Arenimonas sp.]